MAKNRQKVHIPEDVNDFAKSDFKKYKKKNKNFYDGKKEIIRSWNLYLIDLLPKTIEFIVKYGYINDEKIQFIKKESLIKINDPGFIKTLKKLIKDGSKIDNINLLPIIIKEILEEAARTNEKIKAADPNAEIYDMSDLVELSKLIMRKKLKKAAKLGIPEDVAFSALSIIPCKDALASSQFYRIHGFFDTLYEHAKTAKIDFNNIVSIVLDEKYKAAAITFALLERKEKFARLTDSQKTLYLDITNWCFNSMEKSYKKSDLRGIIEAYVNGRMRDDNNGKDSKRRYSLTSLSSDYPRISAIVENIIKDDNNLAKYLN